MLYNMLYFSKNNLREKIMFIFMHFCLEHCQLELLSLLGWDTLFIEDFCQLHC